MKSLPTLCRIASRLLQALPCADPAVRPRVLPGVSLSLLAGVLHFTGATALAAPPPTGQVTSALDSGAGSLREVIAAAPAGAVIRFDPTLAGQSIRLASELVLAKNLTIDAMDPAVAVTLEGNGTERVLRVAPDCAVTVRGLTLKNGKSSGGGGLNGFGGGLCNEGVTTLERCALIANQSTAYGGGVHNALNATLTVRASSFENNSANLYGGALSNSGTLTVDGSSFASNRSNYEGGGVYSDSYGVLTLENSTFTANHAVYYGGAIFNGSPLTLRHGTLVGNTAERIGGGVYNDYFGTLRYENSVIVGNQAPENPENFGTWTGEGNFTEGDPKLAEPAFQGGPTRTMRPLPDSPLRNAGKPTTLANDQRGQPRTLDGAPDIGAFELPVSDYNATGLTIHTRSAEIEPQGVFEISTDPEFEPVVSTLAGTLGEGFADGPRADARFRYPSGIARDAQGNLFIADTANHRIRMLQPDGTVATIAGDGSFGMAVGSGAVAAFAFPAAVAAGPDGNLYVADTFNHRICKLTRPAVVGGEWIVSTLAGTGAAGFADGMAAVARFNFPYGITLDSDGNVYVADALNHRIRKVTPSGSVSTYAGTGSAGLLDNANSLAARFDTPQGIVAADGRLFVADTANHRIRAIVLTQEAAARTVSTFAGSARGLRNGTGTSAEFNNPVGIASDGTGSLYVADEGNHAIRRIDSATQVTTTAGTGTSGKATGKATVSTFNAPTGVAVAADGNLVVADASNHCLRRVWIKPLAVPSTVVAGTSDTHGIELDSILDVASLGLDPGTTYYFRWKSTTTGIIQPHGQSFFLYDFPVLATTPASELTRTSARLNATLDPKLGRTQVTFEYSTDPGLLKPFELTTLAGAAGSGYADATGGDARFADPRGLVTNALGEVFVCDRDNHRIRRISPSGVVTTLAGSGVAGFANSSNGSAARFDHPSGLAIDLAGNLYVADTWNHRIRRIAVSGEVTTWAGSGAAGHADGAAGSARFLYPEALAIDSAGNLYVADTGNHRIRRVDALTGAVTTLAGSGRDGFGDGDAAEAQFSLPAGIALDAAGRVLVADTGNHRVRLVAEGVVVTLAGSGIVGHRDAAADDAQFSSPRGLAVDAEGHVWVADNGNHRIRRIASNGEVSTVAGSGEAGLADSPLPALAPATALRLDQPMALAIDATGVLWFTQAGCVRKLARSAVLPSWTIQPDPASDGPRGVFADIAPPLLQGTTYYFRARAIGYRGKVTGDIVALITPQPEIQLRDGTATDARLLAESSDVDFGTTPTGVALAREITVSNPGTWPLTLSAVQLPAGFALTETLPVTVPAGSSASLRIDLPASQAGVFAGAVTLTSDAAGREQSGFRIAAVVQDPPDVTTLAATDPGEGTATFQARVNPRNGTTRVRFEWSSDPEFDGFGVSTLAGSQAGDQDGDAATARFNGPSGLAVDAAGNVYVADRFNHRVRVIGTDGATRTLAGTGEAGFADGPAATARFDEPSALVVTSNGTVLVSDSGNHRIRAIRPDGEVSTWSGLGLPGFTDGIATAARFNHPEGLALSPDGLLFVADRDNHAIRVIATDGSVTTRCGDGTAGSENGPSARFDRPLGLALDASGTLYLTEAGSHAIRRVLADGSAALLAGDPLEAGDANGPAALARFNLPVGLAVDPGGLLCVADSGNHRIRTLSLQDGTVSTRAGAGSNGSLDGDGSTARFAEPRALACSAAGVLIAADAFSSQIRRISPLQVLLDVPGTFDGSTPLELSLAATGLPATGPCHVRAIATNAGGTTIGNRVTLTPAPTGGQAGFAVWQSLSFGSDVDDPSISGPDASPAGDGVSNLVKYALGLDPLTPLAGTPLTTPLAGNGRLAIVYTRATAATDASCVVEWSDDLVHWSTSGINEEILGEADGIRRIRASVDAAPAAARFLRLHISLQ